MSNHIDMQDKCCGHSTDIHSIQRLYKGKHKRIKNIRQQHTTTANNKYTLLDSWDQDKDNRQLWYGRGNWVKAKVIVIGLAVTPTPHRPPRIPTHHLSPTTLHPSQVARKTKAIYISPPCFVGKYASFQPSRALLTVAQRMYFGHAVHVRSPRYMYYGDSTCMYMYSGHDVCTMDITRDLSPECMYYEHSTRSLARIHNSHSACASAKIRGLWPQHM